MSTCLTHNEYCTIAKKVSYPVNPFINGQHVKPISGNYMDTVNPATGSVITQVAACGAEDVNLAVDVARNAFNSGSWSRLQPSERKQILIQFANLIERDQYELAVLESLESGKPISECQMTDLPETIDTLKWHAEAADKIYDQMSPANANGIGMIVREAIGVVGCVLPWNFPLMMLVWKIGPALAMGNSVIIKPAEQTSLTTLRLAGLALEAGIPAGVLNVLPGLGPDVGEPMGRHHGIDVISFTGSTEVGRLFLEFSAKSNLKKIILECGGKNPAVVLSDATDLDSIAKHVVFSALWNMGQNCTANSRLIVHKDLKSELTEKIILELNNWHTGDPLDPKNQLGAIISNEQHKKIIGYIESAIQDGAKLIHGGKTLELNNGLFIEPTVFDQVTPNMTIAKEEIFGPILGIMTVESDQEAIELANDSCYGLQASLFTSGLDNAHRYARELQAGTVSVNSYSEGDITTPFGGYKLSGFGGRDNSFMAHDQYTEIKTIWIEFSGNHSDS